MIRRKLIKDDDGMEKTWENVWSIFSVKKTYGSIIWSVRGRKILFVV
jgi:hypothetical protein